MAPYWTPKIQLSLKKQLTYKSSSHEVIPKWEVRAVMSERLASNKTALYASPCPHFSRTYVFYCSININYWYNASQLLSIDINNPEGVGKLCISGLWRVTVRICQQKQVESSLGWNLICGTKKKQIILKKKWSIYCYLKAPMKCMGNNKIQQELFV